MKTTDELHTLNLEFTPRSRFRVNKSTGYPTYSAILSIIADKDEELASHLHDVDYSTFHNSGLAGTFDNSGGDGVKYVLPDESYYLDVNFLSGRAKTAYNHLMNQFIRGGNDLELTNGVFELVEASTESTTHEEIFQQAKSLDTDNMWFTFHTPTCIKDGKNVTTMVPHRDVVYRSLHSIWNATGDYPLERSNRLFIDNLIEKPADYNLHSCSVMTARHSVDPEGEYDPTDSTVNTNSMTKKKLKQGFTGRFGYQFKNASEQAKNKILALSKFAEIAGLGEATARGCGVVTVDFGGS